MELLRQVLGKPYYESPNCWLYHVDCLEAMRQIGLPFADLTITSPPYNIGKPYDRNLSLDQYLDWCKQWITEVHRLTHSTGAFWLNLGYTAVEGYGKAVPLPYLVVR